MYEGKDCVGDSEDLEECGDEACDGESKLFYLLKLVDYCL